jgi:hypothetical protein
VPVTAKLSRKFYEKLGDDIANELVEWFNQVDATYRDELRAMNEANRVHLDARFDAFEATLLGMLEAKLARVEGGLLARIGQAEGRLARLTMTFWVATLATIVALLKL